MRRLTKLLHDAAITIGMTVVFILLCEVTLRLFFPQHLVVTRISGDRFSVVDDTFGMHYVPGASVHIQHPEYRVTYTINSEGFRDQRPHLVPKPPGTIRVLLVGDSFTFGMGLDYGQTWPVLVENRLAHAGRDHIDLIKAGVQGRDTRSELIQMQRLVDKYDVDVVVLGFLINDLRSNTLFGFEDAALASSTNYDPTRTARERERFGDSKAEWSRARRMIYVANTRENTFNLKALATRVGISHDAVYSRLYLANPGSDIFRIPLAPNLEKKLEITKTLLGIMAADLNSSGRKLIVLSLPEQFQVVYSKRSRKAADIDVSLYDRRLADFARQNGFFWIPTMEAFRRADKSTGELFYRLDGHFSAAGSEIVAAEFVRRVVPLIEGAGGDTQRYVRQ